MLALSSFSFFDLLWAASRSFIFVLSGRVPRESLLVKLYDNLGALDVALPRGDQVGLVGPLPLDEEHELARGVGGA